MTSTKSHVSQSLNQAAATTGILGAVAFWTLRGARMRRDDLRVALDAIGLGFAMPKDPKTQALLRMAVEHAKKAQPGLVFDRVTQTATEIVYAMSERATDDVTELAQYQHRTRVRRCRPHSSPVTCPAIHERKHRPRQRCSWRQHCNCFSSPDASCRCATIRPGCKRCSMRCANSRAAMR